MADYGVLEKYYLYAKLVRNFCISSVLRREGNPFPQILSIVSNHVPFQERILYSSITQVKVTVTENRFWTC